MNRPSAPTGWPIAICALWLSGGNSPSLPTSVTASVLAALSGNCASPPRASGRRDACQSCLACLRELERDQLAGLIAAHADLDHVDLPFDALVERLEQVAEAAAGEYLEDVQL